MYSNAYSEVVRTLSCYSDCIVTVHLPAGRGDVVVVLVDAVVGEGGEVVHHALVEEVASEIAESYTYFTTQNIYRSLR